MAYQPLSNLISQSPTTKELHITTDNWPEERKKLKKVVRDPKDPNFNWWFWCGVYSKKDLESLVKDYKEVSASLIKFKDMEEKEVNSWFKGKIKNKIHQQLMTNSIKDINNDVKRNYHRFPTFFKNKEVLCRILYTCFSQRYILMESYSQNDIYTLELICMIMKHITNNQIDIYETKLKIELLKEVIAYSIFNKLLDLQMSSLYVFPSTLDIDNTKVLLVKKKNKHFLLHNFFKFLFVTMFLKFIDDKDVKNSILQNKEKKNFLICVKVYIY